MQLSLFFHTRTGYAGALIVYGLSGAMAGNLAEKLVIAISSRALFNLDESHDVYEADGLAAYSKYQIEHEGVSDGSEIAAPQSAAGRR